MKIGISTACFFMREDTEDAMVQISRLGVKNCEIFLSGYTEYTEEYFAQITKILKDEGMRCSAVHALSLQFEPQLFSSHRRQHRDALDIYNRILDGAMGLGAECYTMHGHFMLKAGSGINNYERTASFLLELAELASQRGVTLALENVHYCMYNRVGLAAKLSPFLQGSNLGYTLDIKQAVRAEENPYDYLEEMAGRLANVHICGIEGVGGDNYTCLPQRSTFNFEKLAQRLRDMNYTGPVTLEVYPGDFENIEELKESTDFMESVFYG